MKTSIVAFSSFLVVSTLTATAAKEPQAHYLRKQQQQQQQQQQPENRQLQFDEDNGEGNFDSFFGALQNGFTEDMINISSIQAMDPLVLLEEQTFQVEDYWNITTNCTASWPVNVSVTPFTLTGLSTLMVDRFELVQNPTVEELGSNGWFWGSVTSLWNGTFEMLVSAETLVLEWSWIVETQDDKDSMSCFLEMLDSELTLDSMAFKVNLVNPVLEMKMEIGGTTNSGGWFGLGASESEADSFSTNPNQMNFTYDSWTIEIENPDGEPTILNVSDIIDEWGSVFMDAFNTTTTDGSDMEGGFGGLDAFLQDQVNTIMKSAIFSF